MSWSMVFPGQGSQSIGMLAELREHSDGAAEVFKQANAALDVDLLDAIDNGTDLNRTDITQPAMLAAGVAAWAAWQEAGGPMPASFAGHSLGEYSALVAAQAIDLQDAIKLVHLRGQLMQAAVAEGEGAMAAILGLDDEGVIQACAEAAQGDVVEAVNFNSPGQVVIAGQTKAVRRATDIAKEAGAKLVKTLPVSVPSHCALMLPAADKLAAALDGIEIHKPAIPVLHNIDALARDDAADIKAALAQQLHKPVRWVQTVHAMQAAGTQHIVEAGPGKVLAGLSRRIDKTFKPIAVYDASSLESALAALGH